MSAQERPPLSVSLVEAARLTGLAPEGVRSLVRRGRLRGVHVGRRLLIPYRELERLIEGASGDGGDER